MKLTIAALGSAGDVHPFLAIAAAMRARGHSVELLSVPEMAPWARAASIPFRAICSREDTRRTIEHPRLWEPRAGLGVLWRYLGVPALGPTYEAIAERAQAVTVQGDALVVLASPMALGARIARERLALRLVTGFTAPANLRSVRDPLFIADLRMPRLVPSWLRRAIWHQLDHRKLDPMMRPGLERERSRLGLPPLGPSILGRWLPSPDASLALWPEWFAGQDPDWPRPLRHCGFIYHDPSEWIDDETGDGAPCSVRDDWRSFIANGPAPVVFMPGSAGRYQRDFFDAAVAASRALGVRAMLLSAYRDQLPNHLPSGIGSFGLVPFGSLLPLVRAIVHHGGIGSCAQALRAGLPQLVVARAFDQFDNGERVARLGVGRWMRGERLSAAHLTRELRLMLTWPAPARTKAARDCRQQDGLSLACTHIEAIAR